jgi:CBS domain-containing protein
MGKQTVADVMTRQVVYLPVDTTLDEAAQAMRDAGIGDVVVTEGATLIGVVTDRDIVVRAIAEHLRPEVTTLNQVVTREVIMVQETTTVEEAVRAMQERSIRRLLVCDADRNLVGIVSLSDLAAHPGPVTAA